MASSSVRSKWQRSRVGPWRTPLLWKPSAELADIRDRVLSGLAPDEVVTFGRIMIPAATRADRIALLLAMRANAPAETFEAIVQLSARPTLTANDFSHLCDGLGIAA